MYSNLRSYLIPAALVAFLFHTTLVIGVRNEPFEYVIRSSSSSWLQEHILDLSESVCRYIPGLAKYLLPRANPFVLIGFADFFLILANLFFIHIGSSHLFDTYASILISILTIGKSINHIFKLKNQFYF